jgi:hypothetical protein
VLACLFGAGLWLGVCVLSARAQGGAPMLTNDTGTPDARQWWVTVAYTDQRAYGGGQQQQFPQVEVDYGITARFQINYIMTWLVEHEDGERHADFGNSQLGVKWRFYDNETSGVSLAVTPQFQFHALQSDHAVGTDGNALILPLEIQGPLGSFTWGAELGRAFTSRGPDSWFYGAVLGRQVTTRLELDVELYATAESSMEYHVLTANVGARWQLTEHHTLLVAVGQGLNRVDGDKLAFTGFLGVQLSY